MALNIPHTSKKRIVVVGGGFAGLAVIRALRRTRCQVVLIDKHNYHMFKPLLYQVASSQLNVGDIAFPFRKIFNSWKDFYFRMAYIESVDPTCKILRTTAGEVEYDYLILATGCVPNFFGIDAVKREALAMSNITDALNIRSSCAGICRKTSTSTIIKTSAAFRARETVCRTRSIRPAP